jgi:hypothetical protein
MAADSDDVNAQKISQFRDGSFRGSPGSPSIRSAGFRGGGFLEGAEVVPAAADVVDVDAA